MSQPNPTPTAETPTYLHVIADIRERAAAGLNTYGTYLQPNNGRDSLQDAYEEALDLALYIRNEMLRRDGEQRRVEDLKAHVAKVERENAAMRQELANSDRPCVYCGLPAEDLAKCAHGFPGCSRADDMLIKEATR